MITLLAALLAAQSTIGPDIGVGRWLTPEQHGVVEIARCGQSICGKLIESDGLKANPAMRDINNKNAGLRGRNLKDLQILQGFSWKAPAWSGGTIYNARDGGTYSATVTPGDSNTLRLKGCIIWPLCKSQTWTRVR
jgi:uncharacterized protein (DUF2147 family)